MSKKSKAGEPVIDTELKALEKIWYKKLKESGFQDAEKNEIYLKRDATWAQFNTPTVEVWQAKQDYYLYANQFANEYKFRNEKEAMIWTYHANGMTIRDIVKVLTDAKVKAVSRTVVWATVNRLRERMKDRYLIQSASKNGH